MGVFGLTASLYLWRGTLTGMEVADRKSVMRFLLTISVSALPGSRREEERDSTLLLRVQQRKLIGEETMAGPVVVCTISTHFSDCSLFIEFQLLKFNFRFSGPLSLLSQSHIPM